MTDDFENINMENLREVLCKIFFGDEAKANEKYVVPLQGNWYNPSQAQHVDNWIGYVIDTCRSNTAIVNRMDDGRRYYRNCQTSIHLAFIGKDAFVMALKVEFDIPWDTFNYDVIGAENPAAATEESTPPLIPTITFFIILASSTAMGFPSYLDGCAYMSQFFK